MATVTDLGFIGLGQMGAPMAERLLGPDVRLHVFDPSAEAMNALVKGGAVGHASPKAVADAATIVMACLPNQTVSQAVVSAADGIAQGVAVKIYAEMSTIGGECIESISKALDAHGIRTVDAPISGGPPAARDGRLTMLISGAQADVAAVVPWLQRIGKHVFVLGDRPGQAQTMKLVNNIVMATNLLTASEALVMGAKAGLDPDVMMEALNSGSGRSSASADILAHSAFLGRPFGAALSIVAKDMELGLAEARKIGAPLAVIEKAGALWQAALKEDGGNNDFTTIMNWIERRGGAVARSAKAVSAR